MKNRREFLKILLATSASYLLYSCKESKKQNPAETLELSRIDTSTLDTTSKKTTQLEQIIDDNKLLLLFPSDALYQQHAILFNKNITHKPAVIALCKNTEGVALAVKYAIQHNLKITVKSGGHSFEGFSSSDGGMQINMSLMDQITLHDDHTLTIQAGAKLKKIYDTILPQNRILPAGSCAGVGIAGLALGGGYGFFSRQFGLTCDQILDAEMVDSRGEIIHTSQDPELAWAIKGAGNGNFGIITSFHLRSYKAPSTFHIHRFKTKKTNLADAKNILKNWFEQTPSLPESCFASFVMNGTYLVLLLTDYANQGSRLASFIAKMQSLTEKYTHTQLPLAKALPQFFGVQYPIYFKNASAGYYDSYQDLEPCIDEVFTLVQSKSGVLFQINTLGGKINDPTLSQHRAYPHQKSYLGELQTYWKSPSQKASYISIYDQIQKILAQHGIQDHYMNYPDIGFQNWEEAYYKNNYARLQALKLKYDPQDRFHYAQSIRLPLQD